MEQTSVSSGSNPCPYIAYVSPVNLSSSNVGTNVSDGSNFNSRWTGNEVPTSYSLPAIDVHYHSWDLPPHFTGTSSRSGGGVEQTSVPPINQRPSRPTADLPRSASFMQPPQVGHSFGARAGSAVSSTMISPYPGSNARARDRVQALQAYYQQPNTAPSSRTPSMSGSSRRASHRGLAQVGSLAPASHQLSGFQYVQSSASSSRNYMEAENPSSSGFHAWDRDQTSSFPSNQIEREATWGTTFHHRSAPETGIRFSGYRQRCASERTSSQNRS
uniref:Uncharacterized protein n=1 Tax=Kalanchoe fedtschenkoi TaxID=63787 RepID=A0A7N0T508_KALFE